MVEQFRNNNRPRIRRTSVTPEWSVSLHVKNITNERYFVAANARFCRQSARAYVTLRLM
jgi:outer membrane receptor protein involved in Fe transport